ncbi:globin [Ischnura elegans]|uniref:globin n=1 Tax=Ischnura elegans TaxID=197161 RepID=UPI001ED8AD39|nr:globin [Ischnura elegans]XP_046386818.1 globin [Ischnura elegans]
MGAILSLLFGAGDGGPETMDGPTVDLPDEETGLTPRQKRAVAVTWDLVKKDMKGNGVELLCRFFKEHPEYQKNFKAFASVPLDELHGNKKFQAHANSVMYAVTSIVDNLEDPGCLVEMLRKLGQNHGRRHIPERAFLDLKEVLMQLLKDKLSNHLSPYAEEAWDKTLNTAFTVVFEGLNDPEGTNA